MTVSKNFVVKNGLEVNTDLILADTTKSSVGIATTSPDYTLHVNGGIGATHLNVTGVATAVQIDATTLGADTGHIVTGVVTTISGTTLTYTNINGTTFDGSNVNADNLYAVSGIVTNITGTASTFTSSEISTLNAASANLVSGVATNFTVSGVTTLGVTTATSLEIGPINTISVNSGIITATSGVVTYYGDGQYLTNIQSGVGIRTAGGIIGYGATFLDFRGAGVSTITAPVSGIATINITGGGGGGSISVSTEAPSGAASGDLWYSPDRARTFIYYDESAVGYGTSKQWIDASPFNVGVLTQTSLTVPELTITGNVNTSGIITAATFSGNLTGNVTGNVTGNLTGDVTGNADTATTLETSRNINGTAFNGSANITVEPYVEDDESATTSKFLTFVDSSTAAFQRLNEDSGLSYIPSLGALTVGSVRSYESLVGTASSTRIDYTVTVATKTANHRYIGQGSSSAYVLDDIESPFITLLPGKTYRFDQADGTNSGHPLRFYLEADKTTAYTTDVTTNGTPGSSGAYTEILVTDTTPQVLYYQCSSHGYMGNALFANSNSAGGLSGAPNIDVGTGSFTGDVDIADKIIHTGDTNTAIRFPAADTFTVETGGSEALRVNSSQRLVVGANSALSNVKIDNNTGSPLFQVEGSTYQTAAISLTRTANSSPYIYLNSGSSGNNATGSLGRIMFNGFDGTNYVAAASISGLVNGTPGTDDMPGALLFETSSDGSQVPTERLRITSAGLVRIPDNGKFTAGAGDDLQIYHDGSHSYILDNGTGAIKIKGDDIRVENAAGRNILKGTSTATELYFDNGSSSSKKLETKSDGVDITGELQCDSLDVDGGVDITGTVNFHNNVSLQDSDILNLGGGNDLQIFHDGSDSYVRGAGTGFVFLENTTDDADVLIRSDDGSGGFAVYFRADGSSGAAILYHYGSEKLTTTSSGVEVTGDVNSTSDINLKKDIEVVTSATEMLNQLRGVKFTWKENDEKSVGVIAQEVEAILPELVRGEEGNKSVNYSGLIGVLIEAVKELSARVEELENK